MVDWALKSNDQSINLTDHCKISILHYDRGLEETFMTLNPNNVFLIYNYLKFGSDDNRCQAPVKPLNVEPSTVFLLQVLEKVWRY